MNGFDAAREVGSLAARLKAANIDFVCRYYSRNTAKNLSASEAKALGDAGIRIVSVWEGAGDLLASFSPAQGAQDAADALKLAAAIGQPQGSAIYFAVDFDATPAEIANEVTGYFVAIQTAFAGKYKVGVYGSGLVCATPVRRAICGSPAPAAGRAPAASPAGISTNRCPPTRGTSGSRSILTPRSTAISAPGRPRLRDISSQGDS